MFDQGDWPHCSVYAVCKAVHLAIRDIKLTVIEKDIQTIIKSRFYDKFNVGYEPARLDMLKLPIEVTNTLFNDRTEMRVFLLRIRSDGIEYIEEDLVKFLLVDNNYLGSGSRHCMVIIAYDAAYYVCQNSTIKGNAKTFEKIRSARHDIDLHELKVQDCSNLTIKDNRNIINASNSSEHRIDSNERVVDISPHRKMSALTSRNEKQ